MKIKILRTILWLPVGGIEKRLLEVLPLLNKDPFEVSLCCLKERGELADEMEKTNVDFNLIKFHSRIDPIGIYKLSKFIKTRGIDIVHSHLYGSNVPSAIAAKIAGAPVIIGQHHNVYAWKNKRQLFIEKMLMKYRDGMIAVSEAVKKNMVENMKIPPDFCKVIYNGINLNKFKNLSRNRNVFRETGINDDDIVLVMIARLEKAKNHPLVFRSLKKILEKHPNVHLVMAGDGGWRDKLDKLSAEMEIKNNTHFLGTRKDIPEILAASDIFLQPSSREGFSNSILESMAAGVPVVVTDVGGNAEAVRNGEDGYIINIDDEEELTRKTMQLIENITLRKKMSDNVKERIILFSIDKMLDDLRNYYINLLENKKDKKFI